MSKFKERLVIEFRDATATFLTLMLLTIPGLFIGLFLGQHIGWLRFLAFPVGVIWGAMYMYIISVNKFNALRADADKMAETIGEIEKTQMNHFMEQVGEFFEGSQIDRHTLQIKQGQPPLLKIGDDDRMVEVDWKLIAEDPPESLFVALERARMEWMNDE